MNRTRSGWLWPAMLLMALVGCRERATSQRNDSVSYIPGVTGDYLGQTPPGRTFRRFASEIITPELFHSVTVSPDGREVYWAERRGIMVTRRVGDRWTTPTRVSFSESGQDLLDDAPVVSPDNTKLFFNSRRPYGSDPASRRWRFWYVERTAEGWGPPQPLPDVINETGGTHWQASVASSGTLYFGVLSADMTFSIHYSRMVDGAYTTPEPLHAVNRVGQVICPFIAPDESYIIFNKLAPEGQWSEGYYVSFRGSDGQWLEPRQLPEFPEAESSFVTRDGRYLFNKAYWVSAEIIERLRPAEVNPQ